MRYEYLSIHISLNFKGILPQKDVKYLEFIFIDKIGIAYICKTSALFSRLNMNINNVLKFMEHEIAVIIFRLFYFTIIWGTGTGITGLIRDMATLPQGNQEPLMVRHKAGIPQASLG